MSDINTIHVTAELRDYIESLWYEVNARKDMIAYAFVKDLQETESYKQYHKEYLEYYAKYELAKQEIENIYIKPLYGNVSVAWNLDFATATLTIRRVDNEAT